MVKVILIRCNNIEKIKKIHKTYFDKVVKIKFDELIKDNNIDEFIKELFYTEDNINEKFLKDICYGDREKLDEIMLKYKQQLETYFDKSSLRKCTSIVKKYETYLMNDGRGDELKRVNDWAKVVKNIKHIINNIEPKTFLDRIKKDILDEEVKIENYTIGQTKNKDSYDFKFSQKDNIQKHIKEFNENFIVDKEVKIKIQEIFNYKRFRDNKKKINVNIDGVDVDYVWNRHELITMMEVNVCPYCNRQFISSYVDNNKTIKTTADLDHFYSQDEYPFLALSLYNFIPSCQICNSRFKIADDFHSKPHIYPYEEEFGQDAKFKTDFYIEKDDTRIENNKKIEEEDRYDISYLLGNSDNFKIELKPDPNSKNKKKIANSIKTFKLKELYNFHKDYVRELIKKAIIYNESRIDELFTQYPELFKSREEVVQMVVSNYITDEDLGERPLAKLTKDICEELGLR